MAQVLVVLVQRYTSTGERSMAVESLPVLWAATATGIWKYGMLYFHSLIMMVRDIIQTLNRRISILVWDLRDLL